MSLSERVLILLSATVLAASAGNIQTAQCPVGSQCLQCLSSASPELERCVQLEMLTTRSSNHLNEREKYCSGNCPIVLATALYYCDSDSSNTDVITALFTDCFSYNVQPTGKEDFNACTDSLETINDFRQCEFCLHQHSQDARRCLQHALLVQFTPENNTNYRSSFCTGDCPLTLATANWYCETGDDSQNDNVDPFAELCTVNVVNQYCGDLTAQIVQDPDYISCLNETNTCNADCAYAINRYGCCLIQPNRLPTFNPDCQLTECTQVVTGGSPSLLATPLLILAAIAAEIFTL